MPGFMFATGIENSCPTIADGKKISLEPDMLREVIEQVTFAAATDESRPVLTGVVAKFEKDKVTFAAADGLVCRAFCIPKTSMTEMTIAITIRMTGSRFTKLLYKAKRLKNEK